MSPSPRQIAVQSLSETRPSVRADATAPERLTSLYGRNVFGEEAQRKRLPRPVFDALRSTIETGAELQPDIADAVANAMKDWAVERGATHFTHWFQPMTGLTAEKHDSFLHFTADGKPVEEFSGKELIKGEPDASSFPSGGMRATFEARGYTAWDPTSPAFLRETRSGCTLTIPTAFCSWTGEPLDKKTPLLRSIDALSSAAVRLLRLLGDHQPKRVHSTVGIEQEYFLIDRRFYHLRPDLLACGRTLFGARPFKGQELEDHYFGAIGGRVLAFMMDVESELWKLGIPIKTRHNEVAPHQFEVAPIFEQGNVATDHNMLVMEIMQSMAARHGFACLLHEKPFAGVNGSGKHNNWSMSDNLGNNLLEPGHTPHDNLKFMVFLTAVIRAVDRYQDLLRASVATAGNDHRLGANEAPPAILSIYLGSELQGVVRSLVDGTAPQARSGEKIRLGVNSMPPLPRDSTDRNRTSPFAFTGNKFEFRAVGSGQSVAMPNLILNTIVAESLDHVSTAIEAAGGKGDRREAIERIVRELLTKHERILFSGDGYTEEWTAEAERRGLRNFKDTPAALVAFTKPENVELFERFGIFTPRESAARANVRALQYVHTLNVEALATKSLAATSILPAAIAHQERLARSIRAVAEVSPRIDTRAQVDGLERVSHAINALHQAVEHLAEAHHAVEQQGGTPEAQCRGMRDRVVPAMVE
ncbi:MAG TPA: glutamine synthetase III, partial [Planctomycetota bacterium]|nr:glutamine synthetase III [Planctomycetota bacterium]